MQELFEIIKMSLKTYSAYIKSKCERYIVFMPSWGAKEVCQIIISDAYDSLCIKKISWVYRLWSLWAQAWSLRVLHTQNILIEQKAAHIYKQTPHRNRMLVMFYHSSNIPLHIKFTYSCPRPPIATQRRYKVILQTTKIEREFENDLDSHNSQRPLLLPPP